MVHDHIEYEVIYRNIKYPRLEFKTGTLQLILPFGRNPKNLIDKHRNWIIKKQKFIDGCLKESRGKKILNRTDKEFQDLVYDLSKNISARLRVEINKIFFRRMRTKWASCSSRRNLTINTLMKYLPKRLIEYVMYHEFLHLIEKRHNDRFWKLISKRFKNYKYLERSLFTYWFFIHSLDKGQYNNYFKNYKNIKD